jgi:hypothetical protein
VRQQVIVLLHGYQREKDTETGRAGPAGGRKRKLLAEIPGRLRSVEARLSALEHRVGTGPEMRDLDQEIRQVRRDKESAIDLQDFEMAAALRDRERQLLDAARLEVVTRDSGCPAALAYGPPDGPYARRVLGSSARVSQ